MKTKLLAMGLSVCLLASLCACGGDIVAPSGDDGAVSSGVAGSDNSTTSSLPATEHTNTYSMRIVTSYNANGEVNYRQEYEYDNDGNCVSVTSYRADGSESAHIEIAYDEYGNKLTDYGQRGFTVRNGEREFNENTGKFYWIQYEYTYDNNGNIIKQIKTDELQTTGRSITEYTYDDAENRISATTKNENYSGDRITISEYNSDNQVAIAREYENLDGELGELCYETVYEYDDAGRRVKYTYYGYLGTLQLLVSSTEYEYTFDGKLLKTSSYDTNGMTGYHIEEYSDEGNSLKTSYYNPNGDLTQYVIRIYSEYLSAVETYYVRDGQGALFERVEYTYK